MENKRTSKWVIALLVILSIVIMYGIPFGIGLWVGFSDSHQYEEKNGEVIIDKGDLVISNVNGYYESESDIFCVEGIIKNNKEKDYEYITLTYHIYDADGNILGEAKADLDVLREKESWKFNAKYLGNYASDGISYKFSSIDFY